MLARCSTNRLPVLIAVLFAIYVAPDANAQNWKFTPLVQTGDYFSGHGINNAGAVFGFTSDGSGYFQPAIFHNGKLEPLPLPPGATHSSVTVSDKSYINDRNQVVTKLTDGKIIRWDDRVPTVFPVSAIGVNSSINVRGINGSGNVILSIAKVDGVIYKGNWVAVWRKDGSITYLSGSGTALNPGAHSINNSGDVVGAGSSAGYDVAIQWTNGLHRFLDSARLSGYKSATSINSSGNSVGIGLECVYDSDAGYEKCKIVPYTATSGVAYSLPKSSVYNCDIPQYIIDDGSIFGVGLNSFGSSTCNDFAYPGRVANILYWKNYYTKPIDILAEAVGDGSSYVTINGVNNASQMLVYYKNAAGQLKQGIISPSTDMVESAGDKYKSTLPENGIYSKSTRLLHGVVADGRSTGVLRIPAAYVGQTISLEIAKSSCQVSGVPLANACGAIGSADSVPTAATVLLSAVQTPVGPMAFAAYRAPEDYASDPAHPDASTNVRGVDINIYSNSFAKFRVNVVRPTTVFVHGLWSNRDELHDLAKNAGVQGYPIYMANYGDPVRLLKSNWGAAGVKYSPLGSSLGVNYAAALVAYQIKERLADYKKRNNPLGLTIEASSVDVVGHSMGALVARVIMLDPAYGDIIHKIVSVGGPHQGSPLAALLADAANDCGIRYFASFPGYYSFGDCPTCVSTYSAEYATALNSDGVYVGSGAIGDLRGYVDGTGRSRLVAGVLSQASSRSRPIAHLSGVLPHAVYDAFDQPAFVVDPPTGYVIPNIKAPLIKRDIAVVCSIGGGRSAPIREALASKENFTRFMSANSDGIVPLSSQVNGLDPAGYGLKALQGKAHSKKARDLFMVPGVDLGFVVDEETGQAVVRLLNTSIAKAPFVR